MNQAMAGAVVVVPLTVNAPATPARIKGDRELLLVFDNLSISEVGQLDLDHRTQKLDAFLALP